MTILNVFQSIGLNILSTALWGLGGWLLYIFTSIYLARNEKWFWGRFKKRQLNIIFREYKIASSSPEEEVAKNVGDGYQVSKGMAMSIGRLVSYCQEKVSRPSLIKAIGDQTIQFDQEKITPICLGSRNNTVTSKILDQIGEKYTFPFDTEWDEANKSIVIRYLNTPKQNFRPNLINGSGKDYALIVNAELLYGPALVVAGAHMWGTQGAVSAITNREWLQKIRSKFDGVTNFAFIIEIDVKNGEPQASDIVHAVNLGTRI